MNKADFVTNMRYASSELDMEHIDKVIDESIKPLVKNIDSPYDITKVDGVYNLVVVMEELGELIQETSKYIRGEGDKNSLLEELADNCLGIRYIQKICGITDDELKKAINVKTDRQDKRNNS